MKPERKREIRRTVVAPPIDNSIERYLRLTDVLKYFPVSQSTWLTGVASGRYPAPVKLSPGTVGWRLRDVAKLCNDLGAEIDSRNAS